INHIIHFISHYCPSTFNLLSIPKLIELFTHIIEQLHPHTQKQYTPSGIVELMGGIIQAQKGESFSDPACGSGEFISKMIKNNVHIHGSESNMDRLKITRTKMLVSGITPSNITSAYFDEKNNFEEKFDFILSNPPFSLKNPVDKKNNFCIYGEPPASNADFAFLQYFIYKLKDNGRAAIIFPDGILFRGGKEREIRKKIIKENHIIAVIYLPRGIFKNTAIATNIIVLKKDNKPCDLFIIDAREKNMFNDDQILRIFIDRQETEISKIISMEEIDNNNYDLSASLYFKRKNNEPSLELLMQRQNELEEKLCSLQHDFQARIARLIAKSR
ncbi:N-6 DNA methylase, partial [Klebsiella michiganensis]